MAQHMVGMPERGEIAAAQPRARRAVRLLQCWAAAGLGVTAVLTFAWLRNSRFFFIDDKQAQYAPTFHFIGEQLRSGHLPVLVPWQGTSANLLLDPQYGLLNPVAWVQNIAVSSMGDLALASFLMALAWTLVMAGGTTGWLTSLGAGRVWTAVGAAAGSLGGYALWWLGPSWHPGLASLAWLPWFGWALTARSAGAVRYLGVVGASFLVLAGGWPFTAVAAGILWLARVIELAVMRQRRQALRITAAVAAGALLAAPTWLFAAAALGWTVRGTGVQNDAFLVPGWADVLNTGMATAGLNMRSFGTEVVAVPVVLAGGIGLAVCCFLALPRGWWRSRGALTLVVAAGLMLLATQAPSAVGPLRWPSRFLGPWQLVMTVMVVAACARYGFRVSRSRLLAAPAVATAFLLISVARTPAQALLHLVSFVLVLAAVGTVVGLRGAPRAAALGACALLTMGWAVAIHPRNDGLPDWGMPAATDNYSRPLGAQPERSLVLYPSGTSGTFGGIAAQGVYLGQNYLLGPARAGLGYTSLGQRPLTGRLCVDTHGWVCPRSLDFLLSRDPATRRQWVDLLGIDTLTVHRSFVSRLTAGLPPTWRPAGSTADFIVLRRPADPRLVGRLSFLPPGASATADDIGATTQTYTIDSPTGGRVVTADVYWPGYTATWNDQPLPVQPLDNSLVAVTTPPGPGTLTITYRPAGTTTAIASVLAGLLLAAGTIIATVRRREPAP